MPTTATTKTGAPRARSSAAKGTRVTSKTTAAAKPAATEAEAPATVDKFTVELSKIGETKQYGKFVFPEGSGCVGTVYAPLGAKTVKVLVVGENGGE